jgi:hypothetical protein
VQVPEILEFVLIQPEILCDWSRNSGPVVSSQTALTCKFQIFWNRCLRPYRIVVDFSDNSGFHVLSMAANLCMFQKFWNSCLFNQKFCVTGQKILDPFFRAKQKFRVYVPGKDVKILPLSTSFYVEPTAR